MDSGARDNTKRSRPPKSSSKKSGSSKGASAASGDSQETARFHCNYCSRDISYTVRARCGECADFDLCLDCFSVGAALDQHSPSHAYRLVEVVTRPVFQEGWGADHEERLLEGLELYGVGNWEDIAKLIGDRGAVETEAHFMQAYLSSASAPIPNMGIVVGPDKNSPYDPNEDSNAPDPKSLRVMHLYQNEEIACWMPKRGDFVYEYDNDAEEILADMEMSEEDSKQDTELKLRVLEIYNAKLDEREARKQCVLERGLLEFKALQAADKKKTKEEREIREKLRVFARFQPDNTEHLSYLRSLAEERALRLKLDNLREARAWGATTIADATKYAANKAKRSDGLASESLLVTQGGGRRAKFAKLGSRLAGEGTGDDQSAPTSVTKSERDDLNELMSHSGAELLTLKEMMLCRALKIYPHQFIVIKETLIRESARLGGLKKKDVKMIKIDHAKALKIYEYFSACGWFAQPISGTNFGAAAGSSANSGPPAVGPTQ